MVYMIQTDTKYKMNKVFFIHNVEGAYNLCDNGYHKWSMMMEPSKNPDGVDYHNSSEMLESLRKDVECLFGELKQEFGILKYGSRFNNLAQH
jgi:hypothetical protein